MKNTLNNHDLKREIGFFSATVLVVANMVGTGVFTTSGFVMAEVGSPLAMLLCWIVGGLFALCGALCYGELGGQFPQAGGEYVFLRESFGKGVALLSGWVSLIVGFSAPIAAASIAFATYFLRLFKPVEHWSVKIPISGVDVVHFSPVTILAVSILCSLSEPFPWYTRSEYSDCF